MQNILIMIRSPNVTLGEHVPGAPSKSTPIVLTHFAPVQVLPRDGYWHRVPVNDDVTYPPLSTLVHAGPRLWSSAHVHDEEPQGLVPCRYGSYVCLSVYLYVSVCLVFCLFLYTHSFIRSLRRFI